MKGLDRGLLVFFLEWIGNSGHLKVRDQIDGFSWNLVIDIKKWVYKKILCESA